MRVARSDHRLKLASHVRACESDGQVILLDLKHNRYLGVGGSTAKALAERVAGWPAFSDRTDSYPAREAVESMTQRLLTQGLLTDTASCTRLDRLPDATVDEATASLDFEDASTDRTIGARQFAHFLKSAAVAAWWMRCLSLQSIAMAVATRRERLKGPNSDSLEAMRKGTADYEKLRPFVFTAQERCLHDSLALVGYLAAQGALPRWVIGVKTCPFGAHSWVQSGHTVLNDQHEYVRRFRPILVV